MKKLFALVLAVVMICAMSTSVFAASTKHIVGTYGDNDTVADGVKEDAFAATDPNVVVSITATAGGIEHRYAVDIEYDDMTMSVSGSKLIWNVNTLEYEAEDSNDVAQNTTFNAKVINYSDLPVTLTVTVSDSDNNDGVTVGAYEKDSDTALSTDPIAIDDATSGTATECPFDIQVTSGDWEDVANYYASQFTSNGTTSATMATLTITVAKVPTP